MNVVLPTVDIFLGGTDTDKDMLHLRNLVPVVALSKPSLHVAVLTWTRWAPRIPFHIGTHITVYAELSCEIGCGTRYPVED